MNFINIITSLLSTFERTMHNKNNFKKIIPLGKITPINDIHSDENIPIIDDIETGLYPNSLTHECRINIHYHFKREECKWDEWSV